MYKCCPFGVSDGICSSKDQEVLCSDSLQGLLKYQVCYRDSLQCGNEVVFIVNQTMETSTTEFFNQGGVCFFRLRTYEDNNQVTMNVTFNKVLGSQAYLIYKKNGQTDYTQEQVELAPGENFTYSFKRGDLNDKDLYIVAKALTNNLPVVSFSTVRIDIPKTIPDNSFYAKIALSVLGISLLLIVIVKSVEILEEHYQTKSKISHQNIQFQNRLGIDFEVDKQRLRALGAKTRSKFETACFKYKSLFRN